jgi:predicted ribosome quality control (RQC) complex YloA/Tae2 family protein
LLSLRELRRAARVIDRDLADARVERWVQVDRDRVAVQLYVRRGDAKRKRVLELCVADGLGRVAEIARLPKAPQNVPAFSAWLRSHLSRARLVEALPAPHERELRLVFESQEGRSTLLLALFGRRSNLYVLDADDRIVLALRALADTRPELESGAPYASPESGLPREGDDRFEEVDDEALLAAIGAAYAERQQEAEAEDLGRSLRQVLKRERKSALRRLERLEGELAEADQASELQRHGELLKSALGRIEPGASQITLDDYETGAPVTIPLDPKATPRENLDATFKRYQKLLRRLTKAGGQVDDARRWAERITAFEARLAEIVEGPEDGQAEALATLAAEPELAKLLEQSSLRSLPPNARAKEEKAKLPGRLKSLPTKLVPRRYVSADGLEIWVGRSDEANDHLTTRLARGNDLFFHLDGAPGSHVVLCLDRGAEAPAESVLDACELAVHFSKQKNAGRADVHVVPIKNVKKPKGAKPGLVYVTGGRSLHLRREPERLQRLLASRIEA